MNKRSLGVHVCTSLPIRPYNMYNVLTRITTGVETSKNMLLYGVYQGWNLFDLEVYSPDILINSVC